MSRNLNSNPKPAQVGGSEPKLRIENLEWLRRPEVRARLLEVMEDPDVSLKELASVWTRVRSKTWEDWRYKELYDWVQRTFKENYYQGGREKFKTYLERIHNDPSEIDAQYQKIMQQKARPNLLPRYGALPMLAHEFETRLQTPRRSEDPKRYQGVEAGVLFLRYYNRYRRALEKEGYSRGKRAQVGDNFDARPMTVYRKLPPDLQERVIIPDLTFQEIHVLYRKLHHIDMRYNADGGMIEWLLDNGYRDKNISLPAVYNLIPDAARQRMTEWKRMGASLQTAIEIRDSLKEIGDEYNNPDGMTQWTQRHNIKLNPKVFRSLVPRSVWEHMPLWGKPRGPMASAVKLYQSNPDIQALTKQLSQRGISGRLNSYQVAIALNAAGFAPEAAESMLTTALSKVDNFMNALRNQKTIKNLVDIYTFGAEKFGFSELEILIMLKIKQTTLPGVAYMIETGTFLRSFPFSKGVTDRVRKEMEDTGIDDEGIIRRVSLFLGRRYASPEAAVEALRTARDRADTFLKDLAVSAIMHKNFLNIEKVQLQDIYAFAKENLALSPEAIHVICKLKSLNIRGLRAIIRGQGRPQKEYVSLQDKISTHEDSKSLEDVKGVEDKEFERFERRQELGVLVQSAKEKGDLTTREIGLLEKILAGEDLKDSEYQALGGAIKKHPYLVELLDMSN